MGQTTLTGCTTKNEISSICPHYDRLQLFLSKFCRGPSSSLIMCLSPRRKIMQNWWPAIFTAISLETTWVRVVTPADYCLLNWLQNIYKDKDNSFRILYMQVPFVLRTNKLYSNTYTLFHYLKGLSGMNQSVARLFHLTECCQYDNDSIWYKIDRQILFNNSRGKFHCFGSLKNIRQQTHIHKTVKWQSMLSNEDEEVSFSCALVASLQIRFTLYQL